MNDHREPGDSALDALLGEHSTETPPAQVDAAILAAAHRAVDARPHSPLATHAWRWWMPLAAAAVIGAVVVGVLPLAPSIVSDSAPIVSDLPAGAPSVPLPEVMSIRIPHPPDKAVAATPSRATPPPAARAEAKPIPGAPAKVTTPGRKLEQAPAARAEMRKDHAVDAATDAVKSQAAAAGALGSVPESPPVAASRGNTVSPEFARPPESAAAQRPMSEEKRDDFDARPRTPDEWIARIRMLRDNGNLSEATRALAAFRAAFSDADARLPADLREWANALR